jgi:hypothetical protein
VCAVLFRRHAELPGKRSCEAFMGVKYKIESDIDDPRVAIPQLFGGFTEP